MPHEGSSHEARADPPTPHRAHGLTPVLEILRCPVTHSELVDGVDDGGEPVLVATEADAERGGRLQYPIRDGIPVLLADDASVLPA